MAVINKTENIFDIYALDEVLGEGMSGEVRKAIKISTGDEFAVKIIRKGAVSDDELDALYNEIQIQSEIEHPNIVQLFEVYETEEWLYLVMELMKGGELFDRIVDLEFFSENEAKEVLLPIIDAIDYWHELGIVHRDLKPENLLYESEEDGALIKISDFGLARFVSPSTFATTACGTPGYVAPEIITSKGYGKEVDVWSIGIILYILLCGYPPFYSEWNSELFEMIKKGSLEFHSPYWDNVSNEAKDLVKRLLKTDPKKRITLEQVRDHKWFAEESPKLKLERTKSTGTKYQDSLRNFKVMPSAKFLVKC